MFKLWGRVFELSTRVIFIPFDPSQGPIVPSQGLSQRWRGPAECGQKPAASGSQAHVYITAGSLKSLLAPVNNTSRAEPISVDGICAGSNLLAFLDPPLLRLSLNSAPYFDLWSFLFWAKRLVIEGIQAHIIPIPTSATLLMRYYLMHIVKLGMACPKRLKRTNLTVLSSKLPGWKTKTSLTILARVATPPAPRRIMIRSFFLNSILRAKVLVRWTNQP